MAVATDADGRAAVTLDVEGSSRARTTAVRVTATPSMADPEGILDAATVSFSNPSCSSFTFTDLGGGTYSVLCNLPTVPVCTLTASSLTPVTSGRPRSRSSRR